MTAEVRFCRPPAISSQGGRDDSSGRQTRTGKSALDGYRYDKYTLTEIRTLAGPPVSDGASVWVLVPETPADPGIMQTGPDGPIWGPDGALLAFYSPQDVNKGPLGAVIYHVPLVGDQAIFPTQNCWGPFGAAGQPGKPYTGPLTEIPGSHTYDHLAPRGFTAVPLAAIIAVIPR
ncbi:hypothetical protein Ahu01nite_080530 [Winogradskya humida]|uniref:Uncharacterized protein n=1 Tax=Winogradskya humida TaxID=113566 RepID=A0ABQ4A262_9ACTN|nr:hypothetical protein Ahu01nite_080530 [Actinoplanes humidus]